MSNSFLARLQTERDELKGQIDAVCERAAAETRDLSDAEIANIDEQSARLTTLNERIRSLSDIELQNAAAIELARKVDGATANRSVKVGNEPLTYSERGEHSFFQDMVAMRNGDYEATERMHRHNQEMRTLNRAADTSGAVQSITPPAYLTEVLTDNAQPRPIADSLTNQGAPTALSFEVPSLTGANAGFQSSENSPLTTFNMSDDSVTAKTETVGAYYDVSLQAVQFTPMNDRIIFGELQKAVNAQIEKALLQRDVAGFRGLLHVPGAHQITYTDGTPTVAELVAKIGEADTEIAEARLEPAESVTVDYAYWNWLTSQVDSTGRPLVPFGEYVNAFGTGGNRTYAGNTGALLKGIPVTRAASMREGATPQNTIVVWRPSDALFGESQTFLGRFDDSGSANLTVRFRAHKFVFFTVEHKADSVALIKGSGVNVG